MNKNIIAGATVTLSRRTGNITQFFERTIAKIDEKGIWLDGGFGPFDVIIGKGYGAANNCFISTDEQTFPEILNDN